MALPYLTTKGIGIETSIFDTSSFFIFVALYLDCFANLSSKL